MSARKGTGRDVQGDAELTARIEKATSDSPVDEVLKTDERVLARVTDGIYRQPGSAIRELISNAYDADATRVIIQTDRPRFGKITIEDDGLGMTPAALTHLIHHIGGSAKRTHEGADLGITDLSDPLRSPGGRRLIGRIGIGLFSVAQLTHRFQIIAKTAGDPYRTVATVVLRQFSDDAAIEAIEGGGEYEAGKVKIWREPASDVGTHGTTIVLTDIRRQTRDTLQSRDTWSRVDADPDLAPEESREIKPPRFHIGRVDRMDPDILRETSGDFDAIPWGKGDGPSQAFEKLVNAVWTQLEEGSPRPKLDELFDYYLTMVWQLALAIPAPYVDGHPFDIPFADSVYAFKLPGVEPPRELKLAGRRTLRGQLRLGNGVPKDPGFEVLIDDLRLARPLRFRDLPTTSHAVKKPILFASHCREEFPKVPVELSGGPLEFQAYMMWAPKIVPTEHQGVLIRIHGSSGTLFDSTFLNYQVSEQNRLRQTSCEIFVTTGLEGALNIDRESFNYAHPHMAYLTKWLHAALRRLATVQKKIAADIRTASRQAAERRTATQLERIVADAWREESGDVGQEPPPVTFSDDDEPAAKPAGGYRYRRAAVPGRKGTRGPQARQERAVERKLAAIVQLLAAFNLLNHITREEQERLVMRIREILEAPEG